MKAKKVLRVIFYSFMPLLTIYLAIVSMPEPLRINGGSLINTLIYLSIIIILQIIKLSVIARKFYKS